MPKQRPTMQATFAAGSREGIDRYRMLSFPSLPLSDERADRRKHTLSHAEIAELVSAAFNAAIAALGSQDPKRAFYLRARETEDVVREMLPTL